MTARRVLLLAAMTSERRAVMRRLRLAPAALRGRVEVELIGVGTAAAAAACERSLAAGPADLVVVVGICGGVGRDAVIGDLVVPAEVRDLATGAVFRPAPLPGLAAAGTLLTSDELILDAERLAALAAEGTVGLDMETAAVAAVCELHGVPWSVVRAVSDLPSGGMIDPAVAAMAGPDGRPRLAAVGRYLARRPTRVVSLARLGRDAARASQAAADAAVGALLS